MDLAKIKIGSQILTDDQCMEIEKINDDAVKVRVKEITNQIEHFFVTCNFRDFFKFIKEYSIFKETSLKTHMTRKDIKKQRCFKNPKDKLEEQKKQRSNDIKEKQKTERDEQIMLSRQKVSLLSQKNAKINLPDDVHMDDMNLLSKKNPEVNPEVNLDEEFQKIDRIVFFEEKYHGLLEKQACSLYSIVVTFFNENQDVDLEGFSDEFNDIEVMEKKLNTWVIEKRSEIQNRTKIKTYFMFKMMFDILYKKCMLHLSDPISVKDCNFFAVATNLFGYVSSFPDITFLNITNLTIVGVHLENGFFNEKFLINLVTLELNNCLLLDIPLNALKNCVYLKTLNLNNNFLEEIPFLPENIEKIDFSNNKLDDKGIRNILHLKKIKILDIGNNQLTTIPVLRSVEYLYLPHNHIQNDKEDSQLECLVNLRVIVLSYNKLTRLPLLIPSCLKKLYVNNNDIIYFDPLTFKGKYNLSYIDISGNNMLDKEKFVQAISPFLQKNCCVYLSNSHHAYGKIDLDNGFFHTVGKNTSSSWRRNKTKCDY